MKQNLPLVIGASGLIGNILWRRLLCEGCQGTFYSHPLPNLARLDICHAAETSSVIKRLAPSIIFLTAAMPSVDACELEPEKCWAINVEGPGNVIHGAREIRAKLVYFSSDYVFDGQCGPYSETDEPRPVNVYGKAKLATERAIQDQLDDYLIVRVNVVYGWECRRKNFVLGVLDRLGSGQEMEVPSDQVGCPTFADNMVDAVLELVGLGQCGVFHIAGPQLMNRYAFGSMVADTFELDRHLLRPVQTAELRQPAARPLRAGLRVNRIQQIVATRLMNPLDGLRLMKQQGNPFASDQLLKEKIAIQQ